MKLEIFDVSDKGLTIRADEELKAEFREWKEEHGIAQDEGAYSDIDALLDVLESLFCNSSFELWTGEESDERNLHRHIGALWGGFLISNNHQEDDDGNITDSGDVYVYRQYENKNLVEELLENGEVFLPKVGDA